MKAIFTTRKMLLLLFITGISQAMMAQRFVHPGIPFTKSDLALLKTNITKEPWLSAYNSFRNNGRSKLSYQMQGPFTEVGRSPDINRTQWQSDMMAIHNLALMWIFTGDTAYARKSTNMLDAWALTNTIWSGGENMLDLGDYARYYVTAADILRGTYAGWTADNTAHLKNYFEKVIWPTSWVPGPLRDHNKGAIQLEVALSVAAFLDDKEKWDQAIEVYRMDAGGGLRNSLPEGEVADAGRDDHWHAQMDALVWGAEVAWKQGIDLFAELDNRLLAVGELYNHYAIDPTGLTYIPFGGYSTYYTNWGIPSGARHQAPYNNIIQAAYSLRKGIATPYTDRMRTLVGEGQNSFLFYKSADTSTAAKLTPIMYPAAETVSTLTNVDIGATGIGGSAVYDKGVWTVKGGGTSVADINNFTFKRVSGDAAIVAKVESNDQGGAITGLVIRESPDPGSKYISADLLAWGGMKANGRGDTQRMAGSHWQPKAPWWLKLERVGNRVFTYHSQDGVHWSNNALFITTFPAETYIGLYTLSNNTSVLNTVVFSHVSITNTNAPGAPVIKSATLVSSKIDTAFRYAITASGQPGSFSASGLPPGLSIDAATGIISGTPTTLGITRVTASATNASGTGTAMVIISITNNTAPRAPRLNGHAVNVDVRLAWDYPPNAITYTVKRALSPDGPFVPIQSGITNRNFTDMDPVPGVNNYYVVSAFSGNLESWNSNVVYIIVPPAAPAKPATVSKNGEIDLSWTAASGAITYIVKRAAISGGPYTTIDTVANTSYIDKDVVNGSPYYYVVSSLVSTLESTNSPEAFGVPGASSGTWSPTPSSDIWNLGTDWEEGGVPVSPAILTFNASTDSILSNDINGLTVSRILFDAEANAYTLNGNAIVLKNDLVNNSGNEQTINLPLVLGADLNVNTITQNIVLSDSISGSGTLLKTGQSLLFMSGNNTYTGNTTINGTAGGWPPQNGIGISGTSALGKGKIIMHGGSLFSTADATIYNDIEISTGNWSYFYQTGGAMIVKGSLIGSGTVMEDCNTYSGLRLQGDNSNFSGEFRTRNRSGYHRVFFDNAAAGSAKATWILDANNPYANVLNYGTDTMYFGALWGGGYIRSYWGNPTISIGALNASTTFSGGMRDFINIEKTGTGTLTFTGNHVYTGTTTIADGTFLLNNNPGTGSFYSPVIARSGTFGGTGKSDASVNIGTGATLAPGDKGVGTLRSRSLTMNAGAIYQAELHASDTTADKIKTDSVMLDHPRLSVLLTDTVQLAAGSTFMILDNTGNDAVKGTFEGLPEAALLSVSGNSLRITYTGGTGNDIVLTVERAAPVVDTPVVDTPATDTLIAQLIAFNQVPEIAVGDADYQLRAVATSGLPVTFSSSDETVAVIVNGYLHVLKAGDVVITASQAGNTRYKATSTKQTVRVNEGKKDNGALQVDIYPNPVSDALMVHVSKVTENAMLEVYDNQGALIYRQPLTMTVSTIDVKRWSQGQYYIRINNGYIYTNRVIKL